jgi:AhpD family alkylhydroperoxidase
MENNLNALHEELVAIGAAIGANCEPCLKFHVQKSRTLGVADEQLRAAFAVAQKVKDTPARHIAQAAERLLASENRASAAPSASGCCG